MNATTRVLLTALLCAAAIGCSKKVKEAPPVETPVTEAPAATEPAPSNGMYTPADLDTDACLRTRVIYFDFDQDAVRPEFQQAIA